MNGLTGEQIDKIKARLDALECIQGILSRVRTLGDKDWRRSPTRGAWIETARAASRAC